MVAVLGQRTASTAGLPASRAIISRPGLTEHIFVGLTFFTLLFQFPTEWFLVAQPGAASEGAPITTAVIIALTALPILRVIGNFDLLIRLVKLDGRLTLFMMLAAASFFWSAEPALTARQAVLYLTTFGWVGYLVLRFEFREIVRNIAIGVVPGAFLNLFFVLALPQYGLTRFGWDGVFTQKNALGYTAAMSVPLLLIAAGSDRRRRVLYYLTAAVYLVLLAGSESKTMLVATLLPIGLLFVFHGFRGKKTLRGAVITSLVGSTIFMVLFVTANLVFIASLLDKDVTLTGRTDLWVDLLPIAGERPVLGHGLGAVFGGYFSPVHEVWIQNRWNPSHAHNAILQTWLELGLVGVALFLGIYFRAIRRAIDAVRIIPGRLGLWPLSFLTTTLLISVSESGVMAALPSLSLYVLCIWTVALNTEPVEGNEAIESDQLQDASEISIAAN